MNLTWHGFSTIKLQTQAATAVINPFQDQGSLHMPKFKADVVASTDLSDDQCNNLDRISGDPFRITTPGEYEAHDLFWYGIPAGGSAVWYLIEIDGLRIGHLGSSLTPATPAALEHLEGLDVLLLPVTGASSGQLSKLVSQLEPRLLVPLQFRPADAKQPAELDDLSAFLKEFAVKDPTPQAKLSLKANQLPTGEMQTVILSPAS